jgi:TolA-binding protein
MKWVGIGVVGGVGLAGAAAVASGPAVSRPASHAEVVVPAPVPEPVPRPAPATPDLPAPSRAVEAPVVAVTTTPGAPAAHASASEPVAPAPVLEIGAPLAAEVAYVDRARALLASGQVEPGLALLRNYERDFPEARLLPEVLFLQLETCDRLGRTSEARSAARRLLEGFPKSPHASRARKLLFP